MILNERNMQQTNDELFLDKFKLAIEANYRISSLKINDLAQKLNTSERHLYRKIKENSDLSPSEHLRQKRLSKATELLSQGKSASFVSFEVGFSSHSHFASCFKAHFGCSPSQYRRLARIRRAKITSSFPIASPIIKPSAHNEEKQIPSISEQSTLQAL